MGSTSVLVSLFMNNFEFHFIGGITASGLPEAGKYYNVPNETYNFTGNYNIIDERKSFEARHHFKMNVQGIFNSVNELKIVISDTEISLRLQELIRSGTYAKNGIICVLKMQSRTRGEYYIASMYYFALEVYNDMPVLVLKLKEFLTKDSIDLARKITFSLVFLNLEDFEDGII